MHRYQKHLTLKSMEKTITEESVMAQKKRGHFLLRQELNDYTPHLDSKCSLIFMLIVSLGFGGLSFLIFTTVEKSKFYSSDYSSCGEAICNIDIKVEKDLFSPIYVHYTLTNFFSNHKLYVKSKSFDQFKGLEPSKDSVCNVANTNKEVFDLADNDTVSVLKSITNSTLNANETAIPCGLISKTMFKGKPKTTI